MKTRFTFLITVLLLSNIAFAQNYHIDWHVIGSGGGRSQSSSYQLDGTIGQPIVGQLSSANYRIDAGFWVGAGEQGPICEYVVGDVNNSISFNGLDVTYGVSYFKGGPPPAFSCECTPGHTWFVSGDVNASCSYNGLDITYAVAYFKGGPSPNPCTDCPPAGRILASPIIPGIEPVPAVQPILMPPHIDKPIVDGIK